MSKEKTAATPPAIEMPIDKAGQLIASMAQKLETTPAPEPEVTETQESDIIIPETEPEINDVDRELIFHAPDEEGEDDE